MKAYAHRPVTHEEEKRVPAPLPGKVHHLTERASELVVGVIETAKVIREGRLTDDVEGNTTHPARDLDRLLFLIAEDIAYPLVAQPISLLEENRRQSSDLSAAESRVEQLALTTMIFAFSEEDAFAENASEIASYLLRLRKVVSIGAAHASAERLVSSRRERQAYRM